MEYLLERNNPEEQELAAVIAPGIWTRPIQCCMEESLGIQRLLSKRQKICYEANGTSCSMVAVSNMATPVRW
jgi:hypothetical protein